MSSEESPEAPERGPVPFVTFYSFKGGVGRSMALINVAGILAGRGFDVLVIDLDLEAPGISYLIPHRPEAPEEALPGFVELMADAAERGPEADLFALEPTQAIERYTQVYELPEEIRQFPGGSLRIMPAGRFGAGYQGRLDALDLPGLYRAGRGQALVRAFKTIVQESRRFDYVLLDSRTGFSDEAGICTRDLADHLMVVTGLNHQNIKGTTEFLRVLREATGGDKSLRFILSPVPNGEDALVDAREQVAQEAFSGAWGGPVDLSLQIPYHPQLALTEEPHIFRRRRGYLFDAYMAIERAVMESLGHSTADIAETAKKDLKERRYGPLLWHLNRLVRLDGGVEMLEQLSLLIKPPDLVKMPDVLITLLQEHLPADSWAADTLARELATAQDVRAEGFFTKALRLTPSDPDYLCRYANFLWMVKGSWEKAQDLFQRALEAAPSDPDVLVSFAHCLSTKDGEHAQADRLWQEAIKVYPRNSILIASSYAMFLADTGKGYAHVEVAIKKDIDQDAGDANNWGNLSKYLFIRGQLDEAEDAMKKALAGPIKDPALLCELHFYAYAHLWAKYPHALQELRGLLTRGLRSRGWRLAANVERARVQAHPEIGLVAALAQVIAGWEPLERLAEFPAWSALPDPASP